jgi:hypothetical protein
MKEYTLVNRFMKRYEIEGASEGEIKGGVIFDDRELCIEEERM